jgi:hypothetical protein
MYQRTRSRSRPRASRPSLEVLESRNLPSFLPPLEYYLGTHPFGLAVGDFNGDGNPDLVVGNGPEASLSILLNNGDGTFSPGATIGVDPDPVSVAVGDFRGIGVADLAAVSSNGTVSVLLGNGDGTFGQPTRYRVGARPDFVAVADLNRDGVPDLVTANFAGNSVSVLLGNGDGTFGPASDFDAGSTPFALTIGSFRGDGRLDLAVANHDTSGLSVLLNNGDGTFGSPRTYAVGPGPVSVAAGDLNGDGVLDLVTANYGIGGGNTGNTVSVLLGNGDGTFVPARNDVVPLGVDSVVLGHFTGSGNLDLATGHCYSDGIVDIRQVSVYHGNGDGTFGARDDYPLSNHPNYVIVSADFNGDGLPDLATPNIDHVAVLLQSAGYAPGGPPRPPGRGGRERPAAAELVVDHWPRASQETGSGASPIREERPPTQPAVAEPGVWVLGGTLARRRWSLILGFEVLGDW